MINNLTATTPIVQIGQIKTFGVCGPKYAVTGRERLSKEGEWLVPIRVIESGEELDYRYSRFTLDPEAR
ncbi:MAG: DUF5397 domain-containing protein [Methylacidiphilales bacterium]|nr:DUF5397 domain-containing protein [Candidatus Methylacidiphilales bacterium]